MDHKDYLSEYTHFVDFVTAPISKDDEEFVKHMRELSAQLKGNYSRLDNAITGLTGESGEVADLWKKIKFHNLSYDEDVRNKLVKELGDVCWYLCQASYALEVPLDEIIDKNIAKLHERHPKGFSAEYMKHKKDI